MSSALAKKVARSSLWVVLAKSLTVLSRFISLPIFARLLEPSEFGIAATALVLINLGDWLARPGFSNWLVRAPTEDALDRHTTFWITIGLGVSIGAVIFALAEPIAALLGAPAAADVIRGAALALPFATALGVPRAMLQRRMEFRRLSLVEAVSAPLAAVAAVAAAFAGWGAWSMIAQYAVYIGIQLVALMWITGYRPRLQACRTRFGQIARFGVPLTGSICVDFAAREGAVPILSGMLGVSALGQYHVANRFALLPSFAALNTLMAVMLPVFSEEGRAGKDPKLFARAAVLATAVIAPMCFGLAAIGEAATLLVFGQAWVAVWPLLTLLLISQGLLAPFAIAQTYLTSAGHTGVVMRLALVYAGAKLSAVAVGAGMGGLLGAGVAICLAEGFASLLYARTAFRLTGTQAPQGARDIARPFLAAALMAIAVWGIAQNLGTASALTTVLVTVPAGCLVYLGLLAMVDRGTLRTLVGAIGLRWPAFGQSAS